ncbi:MAG: stage 0 sporulation protein [Parcubacteria group bacterium CG23_combo_of_CG06-09_8_20_14_all_35_9]|nr:MAG: stage 0 sporulation protein [Parcubacteria group bacterium CG23_combo_of_CG06-09_8_20_14_all_35_9]
MRVVGIQFAPWEKIYHFDPRKIDLKEGDKVIVKTELGTEMGRVVKMEEMLPEEMDSSRELKPVLRKATAEDFKKVEEKDKQKGKALTYCKELVKKHKLLMKLTDVHFSFDGGRITFAFIAEGKIDFRDLVKDLMRHFQKSIRLQQLGSRDETKIMGDIGPCGRPLCCRKFLKNLGNIVSDLAKTQQVAHRGAERLSGACGRFMCCLAFEQELYEEYAKNLPPLGSTIKTDQGKGEVVGWHVLKQTVDVKIEEDRIIEIPIDKS